MSRPLSILFLAFIVVISGSPVALADASRAAERCELRLVDDLGQAITESLTACRTNHPDTCEELDAGSVEFHPSVQAEYRVEGERHGPVTARLSPTQDGVCTIAVARKAQFTVDFDAESVRDLVASFHRPNHDPDLLRPERRIPFDTPETVSIPSGTHLVSLASRGWAPDLHVVEAAPGSRHRLSYRQREGWSVVIRTISARDEQPVGGAVVELQTVPGFDLPRHDSKDPSSRILVRRKSDTAGLVAVSGLRVPLAGASVRHAKFLEESIPAFSSETGTFRVFTARLHEGGRLVIPVERTNEFGELAPAPDARCGLFPPNASDLESLADEEALRQLETDEDGICGAAAVAAGRYALKVSLPDEPDAYTVQPIVATDGETTETTIQMRPIYVRGHVYRGTEGVPDQKVIFARAEDFERLGGVYPAGTPPVTDESGEFRHVLWAEGRYMVVLANETMMMAERPRFVDIRGDETIDFEASGMELEGRVVDESGTPQPEASVLVRQGGIHRGVALDAEARFEIPFAPDWTGLAELVASQDGYLDTEPIQVMIEPGGSLEPVEIVLHQRRWRPGRIETASGRPAAGAWISVHRLEPSLRYPTPVEVVKADSMGHFEVPLESQPLRLFFGGPGCPLGIFDLPPSGEAALKQEIDEGDPAFQIRCGMPSHLMVTVIADEPELRDRVPLILRRDGITIPRLALAQHLQSLHLPTTTDGQGRIGLVALAPGEYEVFHGKMTSTLNVAAGIDHGLLTRAHLDSGSTIEVESGVGFR